MSFSPTVSCLENGFDMLSTRKCRGEEIQVESAEGRVNEGQHLCIDSRVGHRYGGREDTYIGSFM